MKNKDIKIQDISSKQAQLAEIDPKEFMQLPPPYDTWEEKPCVSVTDDQKERLECSLDGFVGIGITKPRTKEEEEKFVIQFLEGLKKLLTKKNNWTLLQPLLLSLENCVKCQTCSTACPIFEASGNVEVYRPTYKAEVLRRIIKKYLKPGGKYFSRFKGTDIDLNYETVARLAELSYRCTLCRRCAQTCPIGADNGLIARELRKLFSQEMNIAASEIHRDGSMKQLKVGSSTGINPVALQDIMEFAEEDIKIKTGLNIKIPFDIAGADILLMHNAGEFLAWPENLQAFAIIFELAGLSWTLSSDLVGYDSVNYGLWYDDVQFARVALKHASIAKKLGVKKIVVAECGHAHKALMPIADRIFVKELNIPRESCFPILEDLVCNEKLMIDPEKNDFPVTLHDPCNITRAMGIIEPQRRILRKIAPQFREMHPHGVNNYCCGGGSGFAIMQSMNFPDWRTRISGRMKLKQILDAFKDEIDPSIKKYVCAPCSNCKGHIRDLLSHYETWERCGILYGGLVELIVNAMVDIKEPFHEWDFH
ncbi:MAG: 4Fe-4S ferredoxin [Candidatus Schekmanbacteria bacterium RBG_13_48_7]|uniref:4Fe-4S ferredoxin n=1 Tax=Candidatus Schekmanbacteria bacterium RBG_13_48_7 TaxID=1817878 RepID=A0A1F7RU94_9BACT|nr:MAG: 4Fe-4S ferredoxin [Candidatus Schekmanbacteria bacterium RBG_13_48_7]